MSPIAGDLVEPPLKGNEHLTVGHGNSGWAPYTFFLPEGQNVGVGVIKLFLSRKQVDLSHVAQSSPFLNVSWPVGGQSTVDASLTSRAQRAGVFTRKTSEPTKTLCLPWDTVEITVVQQREKY